MQVLDEDPATGNEIDDSNLSIMERRPWMKRLNRRLPSRFRDLLPQAPPYLPPPQAVADPQLPASEEPALMGSNLALLGHLRQVFTTERNIFGLFRRYEASTLPTNDPEENVSLNELSDIPTKSSTSESPLTSFYPYSNRSSFLLSDWYWNGGVQKSQSSFKDLVDIIVNPEFKPAEIKETRWDRINHILGSNDGQEWLDADAGWTNTPVTINVPYQSRRGVTSDPSAGPREFTVTNFYHRSLVSIIREKINNTSDAQHFHHEPYELNWQPEGNPHIIQTYSELYTSPAFIDTHRELQESPSEPGCDLPPVIVALMFWSDVTHLTSFGEAKLWPLYLFFGNDSKYHRCKPSCKLCHHVTYFQKVCTVFL